MSYRSEENSQASGEAVELYKFETVDGDVLNTSANLEMILNLERYLPEAIERSDVEVEITNNDPRVLDLTVPRTHPIALRYIQTIPPDRETVTVFRGHIGSTSSFNIDGSVSLDASNFVTYFSGAISSVSFKDSAAEISVVAANSVFERAFPKKTFRALCNHLLYDEGCQVNEVPFAQTVTVTGISGNFITVSGVPVIGAATPTAGKTIDAGYYDGGIISQVGANDIRMVINMARGASDVIEVLFPFQTLGLGSQLTLIPGCDHSLADCGPKFDNVLRYGGFPYVPLDNPFAKKLAD